MPTNEEVIKDLEAEIELHRNRYSTAIKLVEAKEASLAKTTATLQQREQTLREVRRLMDEAVSVIQEVVDSLEALKDAPVSELSESIDSIKNLLVKPNSPGPRE